MTEVTQDFIDVYLYTKMLESVKPLQEAMNALDPCEEKLIERIDGIIQEILHTEF